MNAFALLSQHQPIHRHNEHGGIGPIAFRRLMDSDDFSTSIDFVDFTIIPPGSVIGAHTHHNNEELYLISRGNPLVRVDGTERRMRPGDVAVVRSAQWHELVNDGDEPVEMFVVQVGAR